MAPKRLRSGLKIIHEFSKRCGFDPATPRTYFRAYAVLSTILLIAPIRTGDLAGYDDASFAYMAKDLLRGTNWIKMRVEHPPLVPLVQAALFYVLGFSDFLAKAPSAFAGVGTVLLVYWLGRRLFGEWYGVLSMLILLSTAYFLKYAARAMTDVPFTFFFLSAICAWWAAEDNPYWYFVSAALVGLAEMTRGLMWLALPCIFVGHLAFSRRRLQLRFAIPALLLASLPITAWYIYQTGAHGSVFWVAHFNWINREVYTPLTPAWRSYTGLFEYAFMLGKSYWPWLPFMAIGVVQAIRHRDDRTMLLVVWVAVVFIFCAVARTRILRYMLPAYPAFSVLATVGVFNILSQAQGAKVMRVISPVLVLIVAAIAINPPVHYHALEIRPLAVAATAASAPSEQLALFDSGAPRWDEASQLQWYGDRFAQVLLSSQELMAWIYGHKTRVFIVDNRTYDRLFLGHLRHYVVRRQGHLVCVLLSSADVPN
jgi:4-amino-4-deoxy-L-arabinose transferase-like glycosyltransferase